jgi:hypothetical protein
VISRTRTVIACGLAAAIGTGCTDRDPTATLSPTGEASFTIISGNHQETAAGSELPEPIAVRATDSNGDPLEGQIVNFVVTAGGGSVFAGRAITNSSGIAQEWWTLGATPGENQIEVRAVDSSSGEPMVFAVFVATGTDGNREIRPIGEAGQVTVRQEGAEWHTVTLSRTYEKPVVVMGPPAHRGEHPLTVRVRNVQPGQFEFRLEEWEYLDGPRMTTTLSYLVVEAGSHRLADGTPVEAGIASAVSTSWRRINASAFSAAPVYFAQVASANDAMPVAVRLRHASASGFEVQLQESEAQPDDHAAEEVHLIGMGETVISGLLEVGRTEDAVTDRWFTIPFAESFREPSFVAAMQSSDGGNTATLRYAALARGSVHVRIEEETSADEETSHTTEVVGYVTVDGTGEGARLLTGTP